MSIPAQVLTWTAASAPSDVYGSAASVTGATAGVLPTSGDRGLPFFGPNDSNNLLPVNIWGSAGYGGMDDSGIFIGIPFLPSSPIQGGGTSQTDAKDAKDAKQWLRRSGFSAVAADTPDASVSKLRLRITTVEGALARNPATSVSIVLGADWRVIGEYLGAPKNVDKLRIIERALGERADSFRMNRDPGPVKTVEAAKEDALKKSYHSAVRSVASGAGGIRASFNDGESTATFNLKKGSVVQRLMVTDLRLSPTISFVVRLSRDLGLRFSGATVFVVDGAEIKDPALAALLTTLSSVAHSKSNSTSNSKPSAKP